MRDSTGDGAGKRSGKEAVGVTEPCASCNGKCCSKFVVSVTGFDVARLKRAPGNASADVKKFVTAKRTEEVSFSREQPFFLFDEKGKLSEWVLCLKKKTDGSCVFQNERGRCSVHNNAPLACRAYPFVSEVKGGELSYVDCFVCPRKWNETERREGGFSEATKQLREELEKNGVVVRRWNAKLAKMKGSSFEKFVVYLEKEARHQ